MNKYQVNMATDGTKEDLSVEENMMKWLQNEWRHLDKRFIPKDRKKLYKETFQQYQAKKWSVSLDQPDHLGS